MVKIMKQDINMTFSDRKRFDMGRKIENPCTGGMMTEEEFEQMQYERLFEGVPPYGKCYPAGTEIPESEYRATHPDFVPLWSWDHYKE